MAKNSESYKKAVDELEKILSELEEGNTDFDSMLAKAKRATDLIKICKEKLFSTEEEMNKMFKSLDENSQQ